MPISRLGLAGFVLTFLCIMPALGASIASAQVVENIGLLRVVNVQHPRQVAPSAQFSLVIDVEYAIRYNVTVKSVLFEGPASNLGSELWHSDNAILSGGGDKLWTVNLNAPSAERTWTLTAFAYYFQNGTWQYFTDGIRGPGVRETTIKVANLATLEISLGVPDLSVQVDGSAGKTSGLGILDLTLPVGIPHQIIVPQIEQYDNGTRRVFLGWRDGVNGTKRNVILDGDTKIAGLYGTQYLLRVNSIAPQYSRSDWYDGGTNASLSVESSVPMPSLLGMVGLRYVFTGWSGDLASSSTSIKLVMNRPRTVNADFTVDFATLIVPMILVIGVVCGIILASLSMKRRARATPEMDQAEAGETAEMFCDGCGQPVEKDWVHCIRCGRELHTSKPIQGGEGHVADLGNETISDDNKKRNGEDS